MNILFLSLLDFNTFDDVHNMAKEGSYKFLIPISTFAIISVFLGTFAAPFLELIFL